MASSTQQTGDPSGSTSTVARRLPEKVRSAEYISQQIERTRRTVKVVDIATSVLWMATALLGVLMVVAVVEHWVVPGGLSWALRTLLFLLLATSAGYYAWRHLWPYVVRQVNPEFAALTIETSAAEHGPSLKNSLLNLLLLGRRREDVSAAVYKTLERQAARRLSQVSIDEVVDRGQLIRVATVFAALLVTATLYTVFSPKSPLRSAGRVLMPWAEIAAPSRVQINDIAPGTTTITRGEKVTISATVLGLGADEDVLVRYTTDDSRAVDQPVTMRPSESGLLFECELPGGGLKVEGRGSRKRASGSSTLNPQPSTFGMQRDFTYRIEAGDARSREFTVTVIEAPTISVTRVEYDYPEYTGYVDRAIDGLGDIRAIEGTKVTIHARANGPIGQAEVDFEADGRPDLKMQHDDALAQAEFTLALRADRHTPRYTNYTLRLESPDGRRNLQPVQHTIDVEADYPPEVELLAPREKVREIRLNETVVIEVEARDPDFALSDVRVTGDVAGSRVLDEPLLEESHRGRFVGRFRFTPSRHGLKAGDVVEYWATARDNRTPEANYAASNRQRLKIVAPEQNQPPNEDQVADRGEEQDDGQRGDGSGESGENGESAEGGQSGGAGNESSGEGEQNDGTGTGEAASAAGREGERSNERGESGENGGSGESASQNGTGEQSPDGESAAPVSSEGDDDGEAFDRIAQHLNDQNGEQGEAASAAGREGERSNEKGERSNERGEGGENGASEQQTSGESPTDGDDSQQPGDPSEQGEEATTTGGSGAGDQSGEDATSRPDDERQPGESEPWEQDSSDESGSDDEQGPSPGQGKRQENSAGEKGGEQTGGAEEHGPKEPDRTGTGSSGQGQSADEGTGESAERGTGRTSETGGDDVQGDADGEGEQQQGEGRKASGNNGQKPGGTDNREAGDRRPETGGEQDPGEAASAAGREGERSEERGESSGESGESGEKRENGENNPQPGNQPGNQSDPSGDESANQSNSESPGSGAEPGAGSESSDEFEPASRTNSPANPGGDAANLEYTRRQTDLMLDKLSDMLKDQEVDEDLLNKLGWSEDDLRSFVERWRARKQQAQQPDADDARRQWNDALRSLGLKSPQTERRTTRQQDDLRDLNEGVRVPVPPEFQQRLRAYNQGVSRAREE
jgi:hypothetical protein